MRRAKARALRLALALGSFSAGAHAACTKDTDCPGELICEADLCTDPPPPPSASPAPANAALPTSKDAGARAPVVGPPRVITVTSPTAPAPPRFEQRSQPLMVLGAVGAVSGLVGITVGLATSGSTCYHQLSDDFRAEHCEHSTNVAAYVVGGLLLAGGIPLIIIGAQRVPVRPEASLTPWVSPRGGGLLLNLTL